MKPSVHERNQLVDFGANPDAPEPPDIGIAIALVPESQGSGTAYHVDRPIVLAGSYRVDGKLFQEYEQNPAAAIKLTLTRKDKPGVESVPLYSPKSKIAPRGGGTPPVYGEGYRVGGQFKVDLRLFFGLPGEPGTYVVVASLGLRPSQELSFEIVR
ncbi:MAG: hypothetical protein LAO51_03350 [Acidobacteriia bacterium]|nr:hypothetical protein [Terriglobia bacterium]